MSKDVLKGLDDLQKMLDSPTLTSAQRVRASGGSAAKIPAVRPRDADPDEYTALLKGTEKGVTRLSRAIDQADEQMDAALRRTEEVHRMTAARREREIQELRQVIAVKERGIDSLRETLSCTKRSLESRVRELEALLRRKDEEFAEYRSRTGQSEEEQTKIRLMNERLRDQMTALKKHHSQQDADMQAIVRDAQTAIKQLKVEKEELLGTCAAHKRDSLLADGRARAAEEGKQRICESMNEMSREIEQLSASIQVLKRKLHAERKVRKASEKWLRAELRTREDMESLFATIRDIATTSDVSDKDAERVRRLVDGLQHRTEPGAVAGLKEGRQAPRGPSSEQLHEELQSAKEMLREKLRHNHTR